MYYIGIDIGSTNSKLAILDANKNIIKLDAVKTGFNSNITAEKLLNVAKDYCNIDEAKIVATGYGRVSVEKAHKTITEITCHASGAVKIFNEDNLVVIDIGGQDTKIIDITSAQVTDFIMNDKCSAGTGRFLDVMANIMECSVATLCEEAKCGKGVGISSLCTVFAESEVISLIGKSEKRENIANAIVKSIVDKVVTQVNKIDYTNKKVCLTGGLSNINFIVNMLSEKLNTNILSSENGKFAGAIGAALIM